MSYPHPERRWLPLIAIGVATLSALIALMPLLLGGLGAGFLAPILLIRLGAAEGNWSPFSAVTLLASAYVLAGAAAGVGLGTVSAMLARRSAERNFHKLLAQTEKIFGRLCDEESCERAARRKS